MNYILDDSFKDRRKKHFHSFEYRCVYDIIFTKTGNNEEVILRITFENMKFKSQFYGVNKKLNCVQKQFYI